MIDTVRLDISAGLLRGILFRPFLQDVGSKFCASYPPSVKHEPSLKQYEGYSFSESPYVGFAVFRSWGEPPGDHQLGVAKSRVILPANTPASEKFNNFYRGNGGFEYSIIFWLKSLYTDNRKEEWLRFKLLKYVMIEIYNLEFEFQRVSKNLEAFCAYLEADLFPKVFHYENFPLSHLEIKLVTANLAEDPKLLENFSPIQTTQVVVGTKGEESNGKKLQQDKYK